MPEADTRDYRVRPADWRHDEVAIARVRRRVFIEEQGVPEAMEWEPADAECDWLVAEGAAGIIGIVRLVPGGRLGRMAVLPEWRRRGIGTALLMAAFVQARSMGWRRVHLHAQSAAVPFYACHGCVVEGAAFFEAGIAHQAMVCRIDDREG